jgi:hypothetical protein
MRSRYPPSFRRALPLAALVALAAAAGCSSEPPDERDADARTVRKLPKPTTGPYVSVAVDNHFHDIHPEDDIEIAADRPFVVENQGRNLHNVTIPGSDVKEELRPGKSLRLPPVGTFLEIGKTYSVLCKYHAELGMTGAFTVTK